MTVATSSALSAANLNAKLVSRTDNTDVSGIPNFENSIEIAGEALDDLILKDESLTISGGVVTVSSRYITSVRLVSEGAAATDNLDTINGGVLGQVIVVRSNSSSQDITFTDGVGNLTLSRPFTTLLSSDTIVLIRATSTWLEVARSSATNAQITNYPNGGTITIVSGVATIDPFTNTQYTIDTEAAAATDDLDTITITGAPEGSILILKAASSSRDVVLKDATGNLRLTADFTMTSTDDRIMLMYNGTNWLELSRSDNST